MEKQKVTPLIPVVKGSDLYKINIPEEVEAKIRHFCRNIWEVEWSGVLFYTVTGTFEDGDLEINCKDIYLMDIGTAGSTTFDMTPEVVGYMADNIELLEEGVYQGLIHSHNNMTAYFSGTDNAAIAQEANDMPHFVSLVVNNRGQYVACLTRKGEVVTNIISKLTYPTWGGEYIEETKTKESVSETIIQYDLEINFPYKHLDDTHLRIAEVKQNKEEQAKKEREEAAKIVAAGYKRNSNYQNQYGMYNNTASSYIKNANVTKTQPINPTSGGKKLQVPKNLKLPFEVTSKDRIKKNSTIPINKDKPFINSKDIQYANQGWTQDIEEEVFDLNYELLKPSEELLNTLEAQVLTGNVLEANPNFQGDKWVLGMNKIYTQRFVNTSIFRTFAIGLLEFLIPEAYDEDLDAYFQGDEMFMEAVIAYHLRERLTKLPANQWLDEYITQLDNFII